jgi:hypothetical protein
MTNAQRLDYKEAAKALGITVDAVRMRVRRGKLPSERDETGTVKVILDADQVVPDETNDLVGVLREQLAEEREARRRADTIILNLTQANASLAQRVPALQAATDERADANASRDDPVEGYPSTGSPREDPQTKSSRGWWSRLFR